MKRLEYEVHTSMTNMQKYAPPQGPTLLVVPLCLAACISTSAGYLSLKLLS